MEELRGLKLSQRKAEYLHGLALAELDTPGGLDRVRELEDDEVIKEVTSLRGVGMWSAQWVLSRALGRPDAFPAGDLALKRIVSQLYFGGAALTDVELGEFSLRWSPYRSLATSYSVCSAADGARAGSRCVREIHIYARLTAALLQALGYPSISALSRRNFSWRGYRNIRIKLFGSRVRENWRISFWVCLNWFISRLMSAGVVPLPPGNSPAPAAIKDFRSPPLFHGHGLDDSLHPLDLVVVKVGGHLP